MTDSIKRSADQWFAHLQSDTLSAEDKQQHRQWLDSDPLHQQAWREVEALWQQTGDFTEQPELRAMRQQALASFHADAAANSPTKPRSRLFARLWAPMALAACLALVAFNTGILGTLFDADNRYETQIGEQRQVALDDGTVIVLDTQTRVVALYSDTRRRVVLERGQARFDVAKDSARPFVVEAGSGEITALGTAFVVSKSRDNVVVTLLEGSVAITQETVNTPPPPATAVATQAADPQPPAAVLDMKLTPGQQVAYSAQAGISVASAANIKQVTAWQQGRLMFEDDTLSEVLDELNRYSSTKILFGDDNLKQVKITGVFKTGDHGKAIKALQAYFPMRVIEDGGGNYILLRDWRQPL